MSELADVNISLVNDVFIKSIHFTEKGWIARTHAHVYDHQTLLAAGMLRVTVEEEEHVYTAPHIIVVKAGKHHMLEALEDNTLAYCIHAIKGGTCVDDAGSLVIDKQNSELTNLA